MNDSRLAAIDIGSDTIHMIVVQRQRGNRLKHIREKSRLLELGILEERNGSLPDYARASIRRTLENFIEQQRGFLWKEMIAPQMESAGRLEWTVSTGGLVWDPVNARYADLTGLDPNEIVRKPHVVGTTREMEASRNKRGYWAGSWVGALFDYHPPGLSLSRPEQTLILAALTGGTDQELAMTLGLSLPTVKKMWLSIYRRVGDR